MMDLQPTRLWLTNTLGYKPSESAGRYCLKKEEVEKIYTEARRELIFPVAVCSIALAVFISVLLELISS